MRSQYLDFQTLRRERNERVAAEYGAGVPMSEIIANSGLTESTIKGIASSYGAKRPHFARNYRGPADPERNNAICAAYLGGQSLEDVGKAYGITGERVRQILVKMGHDERHSGFNHPSRVQHRARVESKLEARERKGAARAARQTQTREMYDSGMTYSAIAEAMGCNIALVQNDVWKTGGPSRNALAGKTNKRLTVSDREVVIQMYSAGDSLGAIASRFGICEETARNIAYSHGARRPREVRGLQ